MKETHKIALWFVVAVALIALLLAFAFQLIRQTEQADAWQKHTYQVLDLANEVMSSVKDAETGQRGFLLSGDEAYLLPHRAVKNTLPASFAELRRLTQDNGIQQQRLAVMSQLMDNKLAFTNQLIELRRKQDIAGAMALFNTDQGRQLMEAIRAEMKSFVQLEDEFLVQRDNEFTKQFKYLIVFIIFTGILAVMMAAVVVLLVYRATNRRLAIEQLSKEQLEKKNMELAILADNLREEEERLMVQHQQVLEARERMILIEKMSSLGTMVGGVAHEINNPLMGVMNYVEYARDKATEAKSVEVLDNALHEINRIKKIVQNMLVFVRVDNSMSASCKVDEAIQQTLALLDGELKKHNVQLLLDLPADLPLIRCSGGTLQQVLVNLLLNARDAVAGQAEKRVTIQGGYAEGRVMLSVCDNGPGVSDEVQHKIFVPFFTTKPVGKGTGLGLAVSRQLVESVGGSLDYAAQAAQGACFKVVFDQV